MNHTEVLEEVYNEALVEISSNNIQIFPCPEWIEYIQRIVARSEQNKGMLAVIVTLLTHKILFPKQDIRIHQAQLPGGFSGRSIDSAHITPFMKSKNFPAMADSGWLTRSLEQAHAYTLDYPGKIKPDTIKEAFLQIIDAVEEHDISPKLFLKYILFY